MNGPCLAIHSNSWTRVSRGRSCAARDRGIPAGVRIPAIPRAQYSASRSTGCRRRACRISLSGRCTDEVEVQTSASASSFRNTRLGRSAPSRKRSEITLRLVVESFGPVADGAVLVHRHKGRPQPDARHGCCRPRGATGHWRQTRPSCAEHRCSADTFAAGARRQLARNGRQQSHDYKFTEAALENHGEMAPTAWRDRIPSASMAYFTGSATVPSPVSQKTLQLLKS